MLLLLAPLSPNKFHFPSIFNFNGLAFSSSCCFSNGSSDQRFGVFKLLCVFCVLYCVSSVFCIVSLVFCIVCLWCSVFSSLSSFCIFISWLQLRHVLWLACLFLQTVNRDDPLTSSDRDAHTGEVWLDIVQERRILRAVNNIAKTRTSIQGCSTCQHWYI